MPEYFFNSKLVKTMKKHALVAAILVLSGCSTIDNYDEVVKTPAPVGLAGFWQSQGPQSEMVSPEAIASLVVTPEGDTLDCRQWQRVIAVPGRLTQRGDNLRNVTTKLEDYSVEREGDTLEYAGMTLKRVDRLTDECADYLAKPKVPGQPDVQPEVGSLDSVPMPIGVGVGNVVGQ